MKQNINIKWISKLRHWSERTEVKIFNKFKELTKCYKDTVSNLIDMSGTESEIEITVSDSKARKNQGTIPKENWKWQSNFAKDGEEKARKSSELRNRESKQSSKKFDNTLPNIEELQISKTQEKINKKRKLLEVEEKRLEELKERMNRSREKPERNTVNSKRTSEKTKSNKKSKILLTNYRPPIVRQ